MDASTTVGPAALGWPLALVLAGACQVAAVVGIVALAPAALHPAALVALVAAAAVLGHLPLARAGRGPRIPAASRARSSALGVLLYFWTMWPRLSGIGAFLFIYNIWRTTAAPQAAPAPTGRGVRGVPLPRVNT